jgi:RNA polymerase sigma-70 factor (ECF subfamily)
MKKALQEPEGKKLLRAVARGDKKAFTRLYHLTAPETLFLIRRMVHDSSLADDILVHTYSEIWRCAGSFKGLSKARTWIIGIARNLCYKALEKKEIPQHFEVEDIAGPQNPDHEVATAERSRLLKAAMKTLSPVQRETLDLIFFSGLTYKEVGMIMESPENTIKTRVYHAKAKLAEALESLGVTKNELIF